MTVSPQTTSEKCCVDRVGGQWRGEQSGGARTPSFFFLLGWPTCPRAPAPSRTLLKNLSLTSLTEQR